MPGAKVEMHHAGQKRHILILCRWTRQWTAEENRHGDLMNKYCYLSGKVNMKVRQPSSQTLYFTGQSILA